jgi:aspartyl-tRNA(Asn)/glutamyl-tRNA(Gln) amidotransferase subunit C
MSLTLQEVQHIADLARLTLTAQEAEQYREQLSAILDYAQSLKELNTEGIPPTSSVLPGRSVLREDNLAPGLSSEQALQNAPRQQDSQFKVPPVME